MSILDTSDIEYFVEESNEIEGIRRAPLLHEMNMLYSFLSLDHLTVDSLVAFVQVYQPDAKLRLNGEMVYIGNHVPPPGGQAILYHLQALLDVVNAKTITPYEAHVEYEKLHPFTDCNGRSGRAVWLWMMVRDGSTVPLGFLHTFYYQTLDGAGSE